MSAPYIDSSRLNTRLVIAIPVVLMLVFCGGSALANKISTGPPETVPAYSMDDLKIPEGTYLYKFAWNGIPSAESELAVSIENVEEKPCYCFEGNARTSKFIDIFWRFRARVVALVDALTGRALKIHIGDQQNKKVKETETVYDYENSEAHYTRWKKGKVKQRTIQLDNDTIDPAALALILCQRPMKVGDSASFTVLVEDDPYKVHYTVAARERVSAAGTDFDALRVEPRFYKIKDQKKNKPPKIKVMTLWLTETEPRIPLKMRSDTFVGHVTGELVKVVPAAAKEGTAAGITEPG